MDPSPYAVERARQKTGYCVECGLLPVPKSFGQENFAVVTAFDVIEHIDDDLAALQSMYGLLHSEGFFVCTVPAFNFLWSEHDNLNHHKRRYTKGELQRKLETVGFKVLKISYFNTLLFPVIWGVRLAGRLLGKAGSDFVIPAWWINKILTLLFSAERLMLNYVSYPFGVSLLAIGQKEILSR